MLITAAITKSSKIFLDLYIYSWTLPEKNVLNVLFVFKLRASYVSPQIVSALVVVGVEEFVPQ